MITALAVLIWFGIILLFLRTVVYRFKVRKRYKKAGNCGVMMSSFEQFKSLYEIAPEKYDVYTRNWIRDDPCIVYYTSEKYRPYDYLPGFEIERSFRYQLYFDGLPAFTEACRLIRNRNRLQMDDQLKKDHIRAQKSFIEHVRRDLELFEAKGANEQ